MCSGLVLLDGEKQAWVLELDDRGDVSQLVLQVSVLCFQRAEPVSNVGPNQVVVGRLAVQVQQLEKLVLQILNEFDVGNHFFPDAHYREVTGSTDSLPPRIMHHVF